MLKLAFPKTKNKKTAGLIIFRKEAPANQHTIMKRKIEKKIAL